jgi:phage tail sheath protein FI
MEDYMLKEYKYGVYGDLGKSVIANPITANGTVVYIGTAPINLVRGYAQAGLINKPVLIGSKSKALSLIGYSDNWDDFTLSEAVYGHFDDAINPIGPIVAINVLDPDVHRNDTGATASLTLVSGKVSIQSDKIILDTLAIEDRVEDIDYTLRYDYQTKSAVITAIGETTQTESLSVSYFEVDPSMIQSSDIIGLITQDGECKGISAVNLVWQDLNLVPNLLLAPTWSEMPSVYRALVKSAIGISGHWAADVYADIPVTQNSDTITKAIAWKNENSYTSEHSKVFWPKSVDSDGKVVHLSIKGAVTKLAVDAEHEGIPFETPANKVIDIVKLGFIGGAAGKNFDQSFASDLTSNGITTAIMWAGSWRLWGDSTAAYNFDNLSGMDPRAIFDVSMSMLKHIVNGFQLRHALEIDAPMDTNKVASILNDEQEVLDGYIAIGALIGDARIVFSPDDNSSEDIMSGNFDWNVAATPTPPLKSAGISVAYTDVGFQTYFAEGE